MDSVEPRYGYMSIKNINGCKMPFAIQLEANFHGEVRSYS